jgi:mono/diheme cytochrome c family protein
MKLPSRNSGVRSSLRAQRRRALGACCAAVLGLAAFAAHGDGSAAEARVSSWSRAALPDTGQTAIKVHKEAIARPRRETTATARNDTSSASHVSTASTGAVGAPLDTGTHADTGTRTDTTQHAAPAQPGQPPQPSKVVSPTNPGNTNPPMGQYCDKPNDSAAVMAEAKPRPGGDHLAVTPAEYDGWKMFHVYCYRCHGTDAMGSDLAPNLRHSVGPLGGVSRSCFITTAWNGRPDKGMPTWKTLLDSTQIKDIYQYVIARSIGGLAPGRPHVAGTASR